jgi:hypothetical protein
MFLSSDNIDLFVGREEIQYCESQFANCRPCSFVDILLKLDIEDKTKYSFCSIDFETHFLNSSEKSFQKTLHLKENFYEKTKACAVDSSMGGDASILVYMPPVIKRSSERTSNRASCNSIDADAYEFNHTKSGKVDAICSIGPMLAEWKATKIITTGISSICYEVIEQSLKRLHTVMEIHGFYQRSIAFAITNKSAWLIDAKYNVKAFKPTFHNKWKSMHLYRFDLNDFNFLWSSIVNHVKSCDTNYFLSCDAFPIYKTITSFGLDFFNSKISIASASSARVYYITPYDSDSKSITAHRPVYAIKINHDLDRFSNEIDILEHLAQAYHDKSDFFYAIGAVNLSENVIPVVFKNDAFNRDNYPSKLHSERSHWPFPSVDLNNPLSGGTIMMFAGELIDVGVSPVLIGESVVDCLLSAHAIRIFHCDIRKTNVMIFNIPSSWKKLHKKKKEKKKVFLIDWDNGIGPTRESLKILIQRGSGQADVCGRKIISKLQKASEILVNWNVREDMYMFHKFILQFNDVLTEDDLVS